MEKFCLKCGTVANDTATICPNCGAVLGQPASRAYPQATPPPIAPPQSPVAPQNYPPAPPQVSATPPNYAPPNYPPPNNPPPSYPPPNYPPPQAYPPQGYPQALPPKKSNTALKWIVGVLITLFVLAMLVFAAIFYIFHRVRNAARENGLTTSETAEPLKVPVCSLLSASEVSGAIGVPIVNTKSTPDSCEYFAAGTAEDMTAKHVAALMKQRGADAQSQKMAEQFSSGIFDAQKNTDAARQSAGSGTTPVLVVSIDSNQARFAMKLNKGVLGNAPGAEILGIGDEAFDASGAMMMVRKGDRLIRITYTACPCGTDAIKPLAKRLADQL